MKNILLSLAVAVTLLVGSVATPSTAEAQRYGYRGRVYYGGYDRPYYRSYYRPYYRPYYGGYYSYPRYYYSRNYGYGYPYRYGNYGPRVGVGVGPVGVYIR